VRAVHPEVDVLAALDTAARVARTGGGKGTLACVFHEM
jgi:hypothetical protein